MYFPQRRVYFDPFGSAFGGFLQGLETVSDMRKRWLEQEKTAQQLQEQRAKREAYRRYGETGDIGALRSVAPETAQALETYKAYSDLYRLSAAKEYLLMTLPTARMEDVPRIYDTLSRVYGIDVSGMGLPKDPKQFEADKERLLTTLGAKTDKGHLLFTIDKETGLPVPLLRTRDQPHYIPTGEEVAAAGRRGGGAGGRGKSPVKLFVNPETGEISWMQVDEARQKGYVPAEGMMNIADWLKIMAVLNPKAVSDALEAVRKGDPEAVKKLFPEGLPLKGMPPRQKPKAGPEPAPPPQDTPTAKKFEQRDALEKLYDRLQELERHIEQLERGGGRAK